MVSLMDMEYVGIRMGIDMKDIGKKESSMEKESTGGRTVVFTKVCE